MKKHILIGVVLVICVITGCNKEINKDSESNTVIGSTENKEHDKSSYGRWQKNKDNSWSMIMNDTNEPAKDRAVEENSKVYYFDANGILQNEGWVEVDDTRKYVKDSKWFHGWVSDTQYVTESGIVTGLQEIDGTLYYLDINGKKSQGWTEDNKYYTINGVVQLGIVEVDNYIYGFNREDGILTGKQTIDGDIYLFGNDGKALHGIMELDNKLVYCEQGKLITGKVVIGDTVYEFDTETGDMIRDKFINGVFIDANGEPSESLRVVNVGSLANKEELDEILNGLPRGLIEAFFIERGFKLIYDTSVKGSLEEIEASGFVNYREKYMKFHNLDTIYHRFGHFVDFDNDNISKSITSIRVDEQDIIEIDEYFTKNNGEYFAEICGMMLEGNTDKLNDMPKTLEYVNNVLIKYN